MKWVFGILCLFFAAFSFGVRLHPKNAAQLFQRESFENYYEIEFFSGQRLVGKLVSETSGAMEITLGAGTTAFKKNEIKSRRLLDEEAVKTGKYTGTILRKTQQDSPLISVSYEDSIFCAAERKLSFLFSKMSEKFHKQGQTWNPLSSLSHESSSAPSVETALMGHQGLLAAVIPSSAARELTSDQNEEQDYTTLLKAGLDQLRNSAK